MMCLFQKIKKIIPVQCSVKIILEHTYWNKVMFYTYIVQVHLEQLPVVNKITINDCGENMAMKCSYYL